MNTVDHHTAVFDDTAYRTAFERFRRIPADCFESYFKALCVKNDNGLLLDVGAGPGLAAEMLLERLPVDWRLAALEPSVPLAAACNARLQRFPGRFLVQNTNLNSLAVKSEVNAAWLSEVVHLLGSPDEWVLKLASFMARGATLVVRTSTHRQLKSRQWYRNFPGALDIDLERHPDEPSMRKALQAAGFSDIQTLQVDESRVVVSSDLFEMVAQKAFSTLRLISDVAHEDGVARLKHKINGLPTSFWHYEMTAYTATLC